MKGSLRTHFRALRRSLSPEERERAKQEISLKIEALADSFEAVASFASFGSEIDLSLLNERLAKQGKLLLPKREGNDLRFYRVFDDSSLIGSSPKEPDPACCEEVMLTPRMLILVPGLAFSQDHLRLGYGGGFYDRFLARHPGLVSLGIGFRIQFCPSLPRDAWDYSINKLILV